MIGFCKCDICGNVYHKDENKNYDGLMVWYFDKETDTVMHGNRKYDIVAPNGESMKDIPEMMDICPDCFERFCNWIKTSKEKKK